MFADEDHSSVALRYHHVTKDNGVYVSQLNPSINQKSRPIIRGTALPPSTITPAKPTEIILDNTDNKDSHLSIESVNKVVGQTKSSKEIGKTEATLPLQPPTHVKDTLSKLESLEKLLTVFPKPPQFKFAGIQQSPDKNREVNSYKVKSMSSQKTSSTENSPFSETRLHHHQSVNDAITASVVSALKRNARQAALENKIIRKQCDKVNKLSSSRNCFSAAQVIQRNSKWLSVTAHSSGPMMFNNRELNKHSMSTSSSSNLLLYDSLKSDDEVSFALIPDSKVRWSGSLGSLYKKTPIDITQQKQSKIKLTVDSTPSYPTSLSPSIDYPEKDDHIIYSNSKSDMLATSSLEQQSAFAL